MRMRSLPLLCASSLLALSLAACGSADSSDSGKVNAGSPTNSQAASSDGGSAGSEASDGGGEATSSDAGGAQPSDSTKSAASDGDDGSQAAAAGPAKKGAELPKDALDNLPKKVGDFTLTSDGSDGSLIEYTNDENEAVDITPDVMSSSTEALKDEISDKYTRAGTGGCGVPAGADSLTCYLAIEDGTLNVNPDTASSHDGSAVEFVNQFTQEVGTK